MSSANNDLRRAIAVGDRSLGIGRDIAPVRRRTLRFCAGPQPAPLAWPRSHAITVPAPVEAAIPRRLP